MRGPWWHEMRWRAPPSFILPLFGPAAGFKRGIRCYYTRSNRRGALPVFSRGSAPLFALPSLMESTRFTRLVHRGGARLQEVMEAVAQRAHPGLLSRAFLQETRENAAASCLPLRTLKASDVEEIVWGKYHLEDERLATCLVPFQYGVNIIVSRLPFEWKARCIKELKERECHHAKKPNRMTGQPGGSPSSSTRPEELDLPPIIQWYEEDLYVSTGLQYIQRVKRPVLLPSITHRSSGRRKGGPYGSSPFSAASTQVAENAHPTCGGVGPQDAAHSATSSFSARPHLKSTPRIPVVVVLGHTQHGKTALLRALLFHSYASTEIPLDETRRMEDPRWRNGGLASPGDDPLSTPPSVGPPLYHAGLTSTPETWRSITTSLTLGTSTSSTTTTARILESEMLDTERRTQCVQSFTVAVPRLHPSPLPPVNHSDEYASPVPPFHSEPREKDLCGSSRVCPGGHAPAEESGVFTFLDTPGQRMFVETRFFTHYLSDYVLLVLSVVEGLQAQTYEAVKVGLNMDKPIVVVFTKMDAFTDPIALRKRMRRLLAQLEEEGLHVTLVRSPPNSRNPTPTNGSASGGTATQSIHITQGRKEDEESGAEVISMEAENWLNNITDEAVVWEKSPQRQEEEDKKARNCCTSRSLAAPSTPTLPSVPLHHHHLDPMAQQQRRRALLLGKKDPSVFLLPMQRLEPGSFRGSLQNPVLDLRRHCLGVCVSAREHIGIDVLWDVLQLWRDTYPVYCHHQSIAFTAHNAVVQAAVLDASKHLFNEEEFRSHAQRQRLQSALDRRDERTKQRKDGQRSIRSAMFQLLDTARRKATSAANRTSTNCLALRVLVREGVLTRGMPFVADQADGRVEVLLDDAGRALEFALPGMAVTLVDLHSCSGCPGPGSHVLSVVDDDTRYRVQHYRQMLQWFVEAFPLKLYLLRPRGMNTTFRHLGNYGQRGMRQDSLQAQLLYGKPPQEEESERNEDREGVTVETITGGEGHQNTALPPLTTNTEKSSTSSSLGLSFGEYLMQRNQEENVREEEEVNRVAPATTSPPSFPPAPISDPEKYHKGVDPALTSGQPSTSLQLHSSTPPPLKRGGGRTLVSDAQRDLLLHTWSGLQPTEPFHTLTAYREFLESCLHVGVLLKVDSWYSARMLSRELMRWGTRRISFDVIGVRFGPLEVEDILFFGQSAKIILCYRTPFSASVDLDNYVETQDSWVLQSDQVQEVQLFVKWCAVSLHREQEIHEEKNERR